MLRRSFIISLLALATAGPVMGATPASYSGANNGNWNLATNWTPGTVPLNSGPTTYDVTISGKTVTFNVAGSNAINSLALSSATLKLSAGDNLSLVSGLTTSASTINATGSTFTSAGTVSMNASSLLVSGGGSISLPGLTSYSTTTAGAGTFEVDGATSQLSLANLTTIALVRNTFTAQAQNAGTLSLAALTSFSGTGGTFSAATFLATGTNSVLRLDALPSMSVSGPTTVQATGGGLTEMTALASINNAGNAFGGFNGYADGTGSKVNLPALTTLALSGASGTLRATGGGDFEAPLLATFMPAGGEVLNLQATGAGSVLNVAALGATAQKQLNVTVGTGGTLNWGNMTTLNASSVTLDTAGTLNVSLLTNIDSTSLTATNGATLSIPVTAYSSTALGAATWQASNANSKLVLPNLTTITLAGNDLTLSAINGGDVELPALTSVSFGTHVLHLTATGANSTIKLPQTFTTWSNLSLNVTAGGTVVWGNPTTLQSSNVAVDTTGAFPAGSLTNVDATSFTVSNGATLSLPLVTSYQTVSGASASFNANGSNSVFTMPALVTLTNPGNIFSGLGIGANGAGAIAAFDALSTVTANASSITFQAQNGGLIRANAVTLVTNLGSIFGNVNFYADGAGSKVSLNALQTLQLVGANDTLRATGGGDLEAPLLATVTNTGSQFEDLNLTVTDAGSVMNLQSLGTTPLARLVVSLKGGTINWGNPTVLTASSVTIDTSGTIALAQLVTVDSTSFNAANGVTITLPNVVAYGAVAGTGATVQASGTNSTLTMPALVSITNPGDVFSGLTFGANGSGTLLALDALTTVTANAASITFQAQNGGIVRTNALTTVSNLAGSIFGNVNFYADGATSKVTLNALTTIALNGATDTLRATAGGDLEAPVLVNETTTGNTFEELYLTVSGTGSLLNVPVLGTHPLNRVIASLNGGTILWGNPTVMKASSVTIDTSGTIALAQLVNIDSTGFNAANGVTITLPNVTAYSAVAGTGATLQASGTHSTLSLPALTSITNPGDIFSSLTFGPNGSGSFVALDALTTVTVNASSITFSAQGGGTLRANALTTETNLGSIFGNFNVSATGAGSVVLMKGLAAMHLNGAVNNISAASGGDVELPAITSVTTTGNIFEGFDVSSTGAGSLVDLDGLLSTVPFPDSLALSNNGELDLGGLHTNFVIAFSATFASGSTGTLDVYVNHVLEASIAPNNFGTLEPYVIAVPTAQPGTSTVELIANGSGANVTLQDYIVSVPEPAMAGLLGLLAPVWLARRSRRRR